jgi:leader peptidase (prepilin peptidase)/N-methyltransferase
MVRETFIDRLALLPVAETAVLGFFFAFGAGVGSFLNVVVYRLPRGESLVFGGSHCPKCAATIRSRDNVPVFGWLLLGGRCRDCGAPIAVRYPLVEAVAGGIVATLAAAELLSRTPRGRSGIDGLLAGESWSRLLVCIHHCWIALTLLAWVLLEWDGHQPGWRWRWLTILGAVVPPLVWPPVGWLPAIATLAAALLFRGVAYCARRP